MSICPISGLMNLMTTARNNEAVRSLSKIAIFLNSLWIIFILGSQQAIRNLLFRTGASTSRVAQTALAPLELLNPRNFVQYWANYANFVANKQLKRKNGKRRFDSESELIPELKDEEYFEEIKSIVKS